MSSLKIAVTGGFGSGKSTVCGFFKEKGYPVLNADNISKKILATDESVKRQVIKHFGEASFGESGPDSKFLAENVFGNPEKLKILTSILHPPTINEIQSEMNKKLEANRLVFVEAALIYEADMEDLFDYIIVVKSDLEAKIARNTKKFNISKEEVVKRVENQIPEEQKAERADFVIENNSALDELRIRSNLILNLLESLAS